MKKVVFALLLAVCGVLTANDIPMIKTAFVSGRVEIKETGSVVEVAETDLKLKEQSASAKIASIASSFPSVRNPDSQNRSTSALPHREVR